MRAKLIGGSAAVVLIVAGGWYQDHRHTARLAGCEQRGAQLATQPVLNRQPGHLRPEAHYSGCDVDRAIGYAGLQYAGTMVPAEMISFTEQAAARDGWRSTGAPRTGDNPAAYCGEKEVRGRTIYLRTFFPGAGSYEVHVSEHQDSGAFCG
jgi:hypothetical protein